MLYVGLTEEHKESATMFANVVGAQVISQLRASNTSMKSVSNKKSGQCGRVVEEHLLLSCFQWQIQTVKLEYHSLFSVEHNEVLICLFEDVGILKSMVFLIMLLEKEGWMSGCK